MIDNRPERIEKYNERFGSFEVCFLGDDDMTEEKLIDLNRQWSKRKEEIDDSKTL